MSKPFKFRYVNEIVGTFVILIVVLLVTLIIIAGNAQQWFETKYTLYVTFPPEGSEGVQVGADVQILGTQVGSVEQITVSDDGTMEGVLLVRGPFMRFVREGSMAIIKKKFGVAGDSFIEITKGNGAPLTGDKIYLPCRKDTEILKMAEDFVEEFKAAVLPVIEQIRLAAKEYTGLAADLRNPTGHVQQILARIDRISAEIEAGKGPAGKLLSDPATAKQIDDAINSVNGSLAEIESILTDLKGVSEQLPGMTLQSREALNESQELIEGIQRHWLLRKYMEQDKPLDRVPPP